MLYTCVYLFYCIAYNWYITCDCEKKQTKHNIKMCKSFLTKSAQKYLQGSHEFLCHADMIVEAARKRINNSFLYYDPYI